MADEQPDKLVIAFNFPPYNDGSSVTVAKRIIEAAQPVDVIAADLSTVRSTDPSLSELVAPCIRSVHRLAVPIHFADERSVRPFTDQGLSVLESRRSTPYSNVYSRSMWPHSHFLAAHIRASGIGKTWTAEFSDPVLWHVDGTIRSSARMNDNLHNAKLLRAVGARAQALLRERNSVLEWAQFVPFVLADEIVFTNEQQRTVMIDDAPKWLRDSVMLKSRISAHPTLPAIHYADPSQQPNPHSSNAFRIGYFGTFYPNRGGGEFLEALSLIPESLRQKVQLDVYSGSTAPLMNSAQALGVSRNVRSRDPLPFTSFLRRTSTYSALLVNDIATSPFGVPSPFLPSKYSDYAGSSAPIMSVSLSGSPLDGLPARYSARTGDLDSIASMLCSAVESHQPI